MAAIPLILLAAGSSTRMGRPKQLLPFGDSSLIRHAAQTALASACKPVLIVIGAAAVETSAMLDGLAVQTVMNFNWPRGMGTSLRLGLLTLKQTLDLSAMVVMLCDQPAVTPALIDRLVAEHALGHSLIAAEYSGIAGVPVLIGREWFAELLALDDDAGARVLLKRHADQVKTIPFPDGALDVDTPDDYRRLLDCFPPIK